MSASSRINHHASCEQEVGHLRLIPKKGRVIEPICSSPDGLNYRNHILKSVRHLLVAGSNLLKSEAIGLKARFVSESLSRASRELTR